MKTSARTWSRLSWRCNTRWCFGSGWRCRRLAGWFIYQRQRANLGGISPRLRIGLTVTRVTVLAILVVVLSGPYLKLDQAIEKRPILAYFLDSSQSMGLPAGPFDNESDLAAVASALNYPTVDEQTRKKVNHISRAKLAHDALNARREPLIEELAKTYDLRFYRLADRLDRLPVAGPSWNLPETQPSGTSTRLGDGIAQLIEEAAGREIAGIVLLSDGQNNAGLSPAEAARAAAEVSAPIFTVPCGSEAPVRDLSVADVFAPIWYRWAIRSTCRQRSSSRATRKRRWRCS